MTKPPYVPILVELLQLRGIGRLRKREAWDEYEFTEADGLRLRITRIFGRFVRITIDKEQELLPNGMPRDIRTTLDRSGELRKNIGGH